MSDDPLDERLRDALDGVGPSAASARRARAAAVEAAQRRAARGRHSVRVPLALALIGAVVMAGVATAAVMLSDSDAPTVPAGDEAREAIAESSLLARAPWLVQPNGSPTVQTEPRLSSLRFPPGTTYRTAVILLARSVAARGELPEGVTPGPPLPRGAVWAKGSARLDLTAPFSYSLPEGRILAPSYAIDATATPEEAVRIAKALRDGRYVGESLARLLRVDVPTLKACQRIPRRGPCRLADPPKG